MPNQQPTAVVEPYKLSEVFSLIPEYDGNQIFLNTFLNSCTTAFGMAVGNQKVFLTLHIKNKLKGRAAELINSRNPETWDEIKLLLESHFGDSRDLTALIQDLQRMRQLPNESPLTFISRLQSHEAKMHASIQKQHLTVEQKDAQVQITESMALNTLLTGLEPKVGHVIRASNPPDMLTAISRIRRELQLNYFENQKFQNKNFNSQPRKPSTPQITKQCSFCKRMGHTSNECRQRQQTPQNSYSNNFSRPQFQNYQQNYQPQQRPYVPPQQNQNNQNRPPVITPNPNFGTSRPPAIQPNSNFKPNLNRRTLHLNQHSNQNYPCEENYYTANSYDENYYTDNSVDYNQNQSYYTANSSPEEQDYYTVNTEAILLATEIEKVHLPNAIVKDITKIPDADQIPIILEQYHSGKANIHRGINETIRRIRGKYNWKGLSKDVENLIKNCETCQKTKACRKNLDSPLVITETPKTPFERINIDILEVPTKNYALTIRDELTKFSQAYPIGDKTAKTVANTLLLYFQHFGTPLRIHCDYGREFDNATIKDLCKLYDIKLTYSSVGHPQSNGSLERFHSTLLEMIRIHMSEHPDEHPFNILPYAIVCYNNSEISQNLVKNNLPLPVKYSKIAQYLEIIELEAFQTKSDLIFVLRIPLVEQQLYTLYHLYPIPILDNRTGLHHVLSFSQKYIARNDDSLMYIPVKNLNACKQMDPHKKLCSELYAYPIDGNAPCEAQLLKNFKEIPKNCQNVLIFGQGYNVQKLSENAWLVMVSEPVHITINCIRMDTKIVIVYRNSVLKLQPDCYAFIGITKVQASSRNTINITDNSHPVLIPYECCSNIPDKIHLPKLEPLQFEHLNVENLEIANHKLEQYSRDLDKLINEPFITKHIPWVTYLTISIVVSIIIMYVIYKCRKSRRAKKEESSKPIHLEALKRINSILKIRPNIHRTNQEDAEEDPSTSRNSP
ncbi:hypothetical protein NQ318_003112 [Aromia moschata]|uniref:RNA-directed DNA polymerase n=1 Tax=Aromia moschata TaxID=1265417 RepID=A0AAV8YU37_9CUCU|nr:hypothetical protein NQ318_003112 [Aromia moschata]